MTNELGEMDKELLEMASHRRSRAGADMSKDEIDEILAGRMTPTHDHLNALVDRE